VARGKNLKVTPASEFQAPTTPNRRPRDTRARLLRAGLLLLVDRSVDALSIDEIVDAAETGKGSFYNHFNDRTAFCEAVAATIRERIEVRIGACNQGINDPASRLVRAHATLVNFAVTDPGEATIMVKSHPATTRVSDSLNRGLKVDLEDGLAAGRFVATTSDTAALFVIGVNQITLTRVVTERVGVRAARALAQETGWHQLVGLGLPAEEARTIARRASALITGFGED
jgi:AcrR family transcriptional regulator